MTWHAIQGSAENEALPRRMLVEAGAWRVFWPHYLTVVRGSVQGASGKRERPRLYSMRSWLPGRWMFVPEDQFAIAVKLRDELHLVHVPFLSGLPIRLSDEEVWSIRELAEPDGLIPQAKLALPQRLNMKMVEIRGENLRSAIRELKDGLRKTVRSKGITSAVAA